MRFSRRQQLREAANVNAALNAENRLLRGALDRAQAERKQWFERSERLAGDVGKLKAEAAARQALRSPAEAQLADAHRDVQRIQGRLDAALADLAAEQRNSRDLGRLLAEARCEERPEPVAAVVSPEMLRLRRDLREQRALNVALQDRLSEACRLNDQLHREAVTRAGTLEVAR